MDYRIEFEKYPDYVQATVIGSNSQDVVVRYMQDILEECRAHDCFRVLIDEQLQGPRLNTMDIFDMAEFAETVAVNRGMPMAMFGSVDDARNWLARQKSDGNAQSIFLGHDRAD